MTTFTFTLVLYKQQKRRYNLSFTDEKKEAKPGFATDSHHRLVLLGFHSDDPALKDENYFPI